MRESSRGKNGEEGKENEGTGKQYDEKMVEENREKRKNGKEKKK